MCARAKIRHIGCEAPQEKETGSVETEEHLCRLRLLPFVQPFLSSLSLLLICLSASPGDSVLSLCGYTRAHMVLLALLLSLITFTSKDYYTLSLLSYYKYTNTITFSRFLVL